MKKHVAHAHKHVVKHSQHMPMLGVVLLGASIIFGLMQAYDDRGRSPAVEAASVSAPATELTLEMLRGTTLNVPDQSVTVRMIGGVAQFEVAPNSSTKGIVMLLPGSVEFVDRLSNRKYVAAPIAVNGGGSGTFNYVVLFEVRDATLWQLSAATLGDRVDVGTLSLNRIDRSHELELHVSIMTREDTEALGSPRTKRVQLRFVLHEGVLMTPEEARGQSEFSPETMRQLSPM